MKTDGNRSGGATAGARRLVRQTLRRVGWDVHRHDVEHSLDAFITALLPSLEIDCVLDVGAHFGEFGTFLRETGYQGRVVSFEPVTASRAVLAEVAAGDPAWHVRPYALGSTSGTATINVTESSDMASMLDPNALAIAEFEARPVHTEEIEVRRLDEVFDDVVAGARRVFLKSDTQGFDLEVFQGASGCLDTIVGLLFEMGFRPLYDHQPSYLSVLEAMDDAGYTPAAFFRISREPGWGIITGDVVLVRRDGGRSDPAPVGSSAVGRAPTIGRMA